MDRFILFMILLQTVSAYDYDHDYQDFVIIRAVVSLIVIVLILICCCVGCCICRRRRNSPPPPQMIMVPADQAAAFQQQYLQMNAQSVPPTYQSMPVANRVPAQAVPYPLPGLAPPNQNPTTRMYPSLQSPNNQSQGNIPSAPPNYE